MSGLVLTGIVVGKNNVTVKVRVSSTVIHSKYKKVIKRTKDYLAHDDLSQCAIGDAVSIAISRPISRAKKWKVVV